nr:hypothetical protein [Tanacetum cinerariifolium]
MHALVEWKLYDSCGVHHVTSKHKEIFMLVKKDYPLQKGLALVMISYKLQVENYSQMANGLILKIYKITNSLRQQDSYEVPTSTASTTTTDTTSAETGKKSGRTVTLTAEDMQKKKNDVKARTTLLLQAWIGSLQQGVVNSLDTD